MLQSGFNMRSEKVGAYCPSPAPTLVVLVVLLVGSVQFVQCHNVDDYSEFDDPELLPLFTQLGYGQISNMTTMLSAEFQKRSNFCVKDLFVSLLLKLLQPWQSGLGSTRTSGIGTALYKFKAFSVEGKSNTTSAIQFLASLSSFSSPSGYCRRSDYRPFSQFVKSSGGRLFPVDTLAQIEMTQESNLSKFKSEVKSSQGHHFSLLQHETKKLQSDMEKMHNKLRYETDDVTIAIRAEFAYHKAKTNHMYSKLDRGIHALSAEIEAAKYDVIKYFIGTFVYITTVGVAVIRILM